jgi:hypothetical protein
MQIKVVGGGATQPGSELVVDPTFNAARVVMKPLEYANLGQILGHYRAVCTSGSVLSLTGPAVVNSLRWTDPSRFFVLLRLEANLSIPSTITTGVVQDVAAYVFRGSTGNSSGAGSSTVDFTGNKQKLRASMGSSLVGELRTIGTTTALTACAGKTNDGVPFGAGAFSLWPDIRTAGSAPIAPLILYKVDSFGQHPIVLACNEGIEIQDTTTNNTTGAIKFYFTYEWAEVSLF